MTGNARLKPRLSKTVEIWTISMKFNNIAQDIISPPTSAPAPGPKKAASMMGRKESDFSANASDWKHNPNMLKITAIAIRRVGLKYLFCSACYLPYF